MKTYAVWLLITWSYQAGVVVQQPYYPSFQECENVRKVLTDLPNTKTQCVRSDVLQTVEHVQGAK
jgi:hypothetical protein